MILDDIALWIGRVFLAIAGFYWLFVIGDWIITRVAGEFERRLK